MLQPVAVLAASVWESLFCWPIKCIFDKKEHTFDLLWCTLAHERNTCMNLCCMYVEYSCILYCNDVIDNAQLEVLYSEENFVDVCTSIVSCHSMYYYCCMYIHCRYSQQQIPCLRGCSVCPCTLLHLLMVMYKIIMHIV